MVVSFLILNLIILILILNNFIFTKLNIGYIRICFIKFFYCWNNHLSFCISLFDFVLNVKWRIIRHHFINFRTNETLTFAR